MKIAHVAVWTEDMQKSIEFYEMFGAKVGDKAEIHTAAGWIKSLCLMEFEGGVAVELTSPSDPSKSDAASISASKWKMLTPWSRT